MIPQFAPAAAQRKPNSGQPNILKLGLSITVIHVLFLLLLLGKAF